MFELIFNFSFYRKITSFFEQLGEISLILLKIWEITFSTSKIGLEYPAVQRTLDRKNFHTNLRDSIEIFLIY